MAPLPEQFTAQFLLPACGLPQAWQESPAWRVLDTGFGDGSAFFATWQTWIEDARRPHLLHYVAITSAAPGCDALLHTLSNRPALARHAASLRQQWFGLLPGFHRLTLDQGSVLLTLCIGPLQTMLREQQFLADAVYLPVPAEHSPATRWDPWCIKALARLCRRGTAVATWPVAPSALRTQLTQAGFLLLEWVPGALSSGVVNTEVQDCPGLGGHYQPQWEPGYSRHGWRTVPAPLSSCVVVGAGLAGATLASALARRGWQVTVLDGATRPAAGASGLPVGLLAPQASRDDNTRSRLSRAGVRQTLQLCRALLQRGQDWELSGVMELQFDGTPALPGHWPDAGRQWSGHGQMHDWAAVGQNHDGIRPAIWHAAGGWVKPARLVQACLATCGVRFAGGSNVFSIRSEDTLWTLLDKSGKVLARAPHVMLAAAGDSVRLLDAAASHSPAAEPAIHRLAAMGTVGGQVSWALQHAGDADLFPAFPVNGHGSFVSHVPMEGARAWFTGASYEPATGADIAAGHANNLGRLAQLLPLAASTLSVRFANRKVRDWRGIRCTTTDRLPAVGPLQDGPRPSLWVSTGMGSRGLTYAVLCAELLAARLGGEPLPVEASLYKLINATRRGLLRPA